MGITIDITAGENEGTSKATASGSTEHIITDPERETFKLNDSQLKACVKAYFGKSPNDAYLRSPTPWGDLYQTYNWPQVKVILVPVTTEILGITSEPTIIKTQDFINNSSHSAVFDVAISETVANTSKSSWDTGGTFTVEQMISYGIKFLGIGGGGETTFSYSQSWGVGGEESVEVTVGSTSGVQVELGPGQGVKAKLTASRGVMKVRVKYKGYLTGKTAVNYNPTFQGHHFWGLPIDSVMQAGNTSNSIYSFEDLEIGYYSNSAIELVDLQTKSLVSKRLMVNSPGEALELQVK